MIQTIGLIVAVYAIVRLLQVPFEHASYEVKWLGLPFAHRSFLVGFFSAIGLVLLGLLTLVLLLAPSLPTP